MVRKYHFRSQWLHSFYSFIGFQIMNWNSRNNLFCCICRHERWI